MTPIKVSWPFIQWGIDIVGPLLSAKFGKKFVVIAIDYFTKWAEAEALAKIGQVEIKAFVWKNIACRFGIPHILVTGNGTDTN